MSHDWSFLSKAKTSLIPDSNVLLFYVNYYDGPLDGLVIINDKLYFGYLIGLRELRLLRQLLERLTKKYKKI